MDVDRAHWAGLAPELEQPLRETEIVQLRGLGDRMDMAEVAEVYLPLSKFISLYAENAGYLNQATEAFLRSPRERTPFVIGVAGSVAVGKSTVARLLRELLSRWPNTPHVELLTTDGFLYPNAELERRGLMSKKGFPESYDRRALVRFVSEIKSGAEEVRAPFYSHVSYDIVPDASVVVRQPDVLIVEGLNVLQPPTGDGKLAVSDLFDFSVYVDAKTSDIASWYEERFVTLQRGSFTNPNSYFSVFADLSEDEAREQARVFWDTINEPNLLTNVLPTRARADLVLRKAHDHTVRSVLVRKI